MNTKYYLGVDIGGTKCAVVRGDSEGHILEKTRFDTRDCAATVARILDTAAAMAESAARQGQAVCAVGVSCGSPMDSARGIIREPPNLPGWVDVPITDMLTARLGLPAALCNDANACALAEWRFGAGKGTRNMVFLTFGTGMGAGLILDGRLYAGTCDAAGEIGHMRLAPDGPVGFFKAGSFEGFCSGGGLAKMGQRLALEAIQRGEAPAFCPTLADLPSVTAKSIADAAHAPEPDPVALAVYAQCGTRLGQALAVLVDVLNPECIVLGSVFARSGDLLIPSMQRVLSAECLPDSLAVCRILPAALTESVGDLAALTVAMEAERAGGAGNAESAGETS